MKRIIRVFPRFVKAATPDDELTAVNRGPGMFDQADEIHVSVTFTWDKKRAEQLAREWGAVAPVKIGGPAYGDPGGEFEPGLYIKKGFVFTSRGCPSSCWFCNAWRNEGNKIRELEIKDGYNVADSNLLACSEEHQAKVFNMLMRQKERPHFSGGLEAARIKPVHIAWFIVLKPKVIWFAYDKLNQYDALVYVAEELKRAGIMDRSHRVCCYVLAGWFRQGRIDCIEGAEKRVRDIVKLGYFPQVMLMDDGRDWSPENRRIWKDWASGWIVKRSVGKRMRYDRWDK